MKAYKGKKAFQKNIEKEFNNMAKESNLKLDNWSKGLLIGLISKAISNDKDMTPDDIEKLKEIKKQLQEI